VRPVLAAVDAFFARHDWPVERLDDGDGDLADVSVTSVSGEHGTWPLVVTVVGFDPEYLVVQSIVPAVAPEGDEVRVLELLTRMNDGLVEGCFELNFDDGTVRLRSSAPVSALVDVDADTLVDFVGDVVTGNVLAADRFIPALDAVISGAVAPAIAVAAVEAGFDPVDLGPQGTDTA
jgi:hypothetical protein